VTFIEIKGELACAALTCREVAESVLADVPLCTGHQRRLKSELVLPRARFQPSPGVDWFVYYVTWPRTPDLVKIGATANMRNRLNGLRKDGEPPALLVAERGYGDLETVRHKQFAALGIGRRSESFRYRSPLVEHIAELQRDRPGWRSEIGPLPWWLHPGVSATSWKDLTKCGGRTAEGRACALPAGSGTDHFGSGRCHRHEPAGAVTGDPVTGDDQAITSNYCQECGYLTTARRHLAKCGTTSSPPPGRTAQ
jgi:hypothetical protein